MAEPAEKGSGRREPRGELGWVRPRSKTWRPSLRRSLEEALRARAAKRPQISQRLVSAPPRMSVRP